MIKKFCASIVLGAGLLFSASLFAADDPDTTFKPLFNGKDFKGWVVPEGDNGHWKVVDGVIDYDAASEAKGDKNLWTEAEYENFVLKMEWRLKETPSTYNVPIVLQDGTHLTDATGKEITLLQYNADSGIYLRGSSRSQINIWCWPCGSGEIYSYRMDKKLPQEIRAAVTPRVKADKPVGEWNEFIIVMSGDRVTVLLNQQTVIENARLPDVPAKGKFALQHHGGKNADGTYKPASALIQFRNIKIRELPPTPKTEEPKLELKKIAFPKISIDTKLNDK